MARKRRAPSPPPPPQPQESSTDSGSDTDGEESSRRAAAQQKTSQNPQTHPPAAAADGADSSDEEFDTDADAFQMRPVSQPGSGADGSSESKPEVPEPMQKKAVPKDKKRPAPEPAPSGRAKKTKAETVKAAPEATPAGKGKKANAEQEKAEPEAIPAGKGKKANAERENATPDIAPAGKDKKADKPVGKPENPGLDPSPPSKSARAPHKWSKEDSIRILKAMAAHVKTEGALLNTNDLLAAVRDFLDRKDCTYTDMYEKVRRFKERYEKAVANGVVPTGEDELQMYNLSEAIWGEKAKEAMAAAAASKKSPTVTKAKQGQVKKEKSDGNSKGGTVSEVPNQGGDTKKGSKNTHHEETEIGASAEGMHRSFDELQDLYPCLAGCVKEIEAESTCGERLKRAFGFIGNEKANALESKIKAHRLLELKTQIRLKGLHTEVLNMLINLAD